VLVKGPPALIVFLAAALAAGSPRADRRAVLASAAVALLVALACALAWLVPVIARLGFETAWAAFHEQFVERLRHAGRTNAEPPWFYVPALLAALAPAVVFLPCLARVLPGRPRESERARARAAFLWGWAFLPVVLFSASSGKETRYLLPTLPAWSLLLAWGWVRARAAGGFLGWRRALARALAVATWAAPLVWIAVGTRAFPARVPVVVISGLAALLARAAFAWSARAEKPAALLGALALGVASAKLAWAGTALEKRRAEAPVDEVARAIASRLAPGEPWILVGPYRSWWDFAVDRPCVGVPEWDDLASGRAAGARYALVRAGSLPDRAPKIAGRWVIDGEPWCLVLIQT
jgi:4-amino-4-deoxy-L-arabinose transferase-like glycosyltransferase